MIVELINNIVHLSFAGWVVGIAGIGFLLFGFVIFAQNTTKRRGKFFLFLSIITFLWGVALIALGAAPSAPLFYFALRSLILIAGLAPLVLFLFFYVFPAKGEPVSIPRAIAIFLPYLVVAGTVLFAPGMIVTYQESYREVPPSYFLGKAFLAYAGYIFSFFTLMIIVLVQKYRTSVGIFKLQARSMLIAVSVAALVAGVLALLLPHPLSVYSLFLIGYIAVILDMVFMGVTLIKYNFWSIEVILAEALVSLLVFFFLVNFFSATSLLGIFAMSMLALITVALGFFLVENMKRGAKTKDEIIRLSSELEEMRARLKVLDQKKSEFLAMVSHHLRDPLTAIKGYSSMLLEGSYGELDLLVRDAIEKMFESSKRLITMISDFMDISNIESGDMKYLFSSVNMKKLVLEIVESMQSAAGSGGVSLGVTTDDHQEGDYMVMADLGKMHQVILSIIDNSIKYTPRGSISVSLSLRDNKNKVLFAISDTGIGMNEITMEKIFKKFSRADGANKTYTEGIGLGLYVAKKIIEKHNGRIWAESKGEGMGSLFFVELPRSA